VDIQYQIEVPLSPALSSSSWISSQDSSWSSSRSSSPHQTLYDGDDIFDNPPESPNHLWLTSYEKDSTAEIFDWKSDHENGNFF